MKNIFQVINFIILYIFFNGIHCYLVFPFKTQKLQIKDAEKNNVDEYVFSLPVVRNFSFLSGDVDNIMEQISLSSSDVIQKIVDIGKNISSAFIYLIVSVIVVFNVIVDKNKIKDFYLHLFPREMRPKAQEVGKIISNKINGRGLFCMIPFPYMNNILPFLIVNNHVLDNNDLEA